MLTPCSHSDLPRYRYAEQYTKPAHLEQDDNGMCLWDWKQAGELADDAMPDEQRTGFLARVGRMLAGGAR